MDGQGGDFRIGILLAGRQGIQEKVRVPLQHGEGRAQVVGEGCVQPFALLYGIPHLPVVLLQLPTHGLKGLTEPAQLVRALIVNLEVQVILGNLPGGLVQARKLP